MPSAPAAKTPPLPRRLSAPERRQQILELAARLFVERGFESVTVADLAHDLQTSRPTIYSYFPSTEAILDELLGQRLAELLSRLDPLLEPLGRAPSPNPEHDVVQVVFRFLLGESDTLRLLHSGGAPTFQARRHAFLRELGERLPLAPDLLVRRQPDLLLLLTTLIEGLAFRALTDPQVDAERLSQSLNTFVLGGARALSEGVKGEPGEGEESGAQR